MNISWTIKLSIFSIVAAFSVLSFGTSAQAAYIINETAEFQYELVCEDENILKEAQKTIATGRKISEAVYQKDGCSKGGIMTILQEEMGESVEIGSSVFRIIQVKKEDGKIAYMLGGSGDVLTREAYDLSTAFVIGESYAFIGYCASGEVVEAYIEAFKQSAENGMGPVEAFFDDKRCIFDPDISMVLSGFENSVPDWVGNGVINIASIILSNGTTRYTFVRAPIFTPEEYDALQVVVDAQNVAAENIESVLD